MPTLCDAPSRAVFDCFKIPETMFKTTWSVRGFLFLLQNHVIRYKLYLLLRKDSQNIFSCTI